jgi:hypothetical protein
VQTNKHECKIISIKKPFKPRILSPLQFEQHRLIRKEYYFFTFIPKSNDYDYTFKKCLKKVIHELRLPLEKEAVKTVKQQVINQVVNTHAEFLKNQFILVTQFLKAGSYSLPKKPSETDNSDK